MAQAKKKDVGITLLAAGDAGPVKAGASSYTPEHYTELIKPTLAQADIRVVNCMRTYSTRGEDSPTAPQVRQAPEMSRVFTDCGFDALNFANNHIMDSGATAMLDTRDMFLSKGVLTTGAGENLDRAREPAIIEKQGIRVAYLGSCSVGHHGSDAGPNKPGISTMRVKTSYDTRGPHSPVRVLTKPDPKDLEMLLEDIRAARKKAHAVVVALHYGMIRVPRVIPDYHVTVARACVDAGADMIVGHAPHLPKGIEFYKGSAIFYSLGVFCMTKTFPAPSWKEAPWMHGAVRNHADMDPDYPLMPYGRDSTKSLLAKAVITEKGIQRVSFLPMMIDRQYRPETLRAGDPRFAEVLRYMEWVSDGFEHRFTVEGDEVVVSGGA